MFLAPSRGSLAWGKIGVRASWWDLGDSSRLHLMGLESKLKFIEEARERKQKMELFSVK